MRHACCYLIIAPCICAGNLLQHGAAVWQQGELAIQMPSVVRIAEPARPLLDIQIGPSVSAPGSAARSSPAISVGADQRIHMHSVENTTNGWQLVAWSDYQDTVSKNGWAHLSVGVTSEPTVSDDLKMYAAGFLEGFVSAKQMRDFQHNANALIKEDEADHSAMGNIRDLFARDAQTICSMSGLHANGTVLSNANAPRDPWWRHARLLLLQGFGILDAYNLHAKDLNGLPMSLIDLLVLSSDGETPELEMAYDFREVLVREGAKDCDDCDEGIAEDTSALVQTGHSVQRLGNLRGAEHPNKRAAQLAAKLAREAAATRRARAIRSLDDAAWRKIKLATGRCSALVRVAKNNSDIFVGHTTFSDYGEMNRIWKHYDFPLGSNVSRRMSFSSYPGVSGSTDDYYIIDSGLVVTETTISMLSDSAFDALNDSAPAVPDYMRIMLSNRLARTGEEWVEYMQKSATGTYNSQWMVVDYNKFTPGRTLPKGTLWVLEQAPGSSVASDETQWLQGVGFWSSENRGFFNATRNASRETDAEDLHGDLFSAEHNPRANIFRKTAPAVNLLQDMREEMQRNEWPHDIDGGPRNTPDHAVAARGDLMYKGAASPNGAVDSKVTSSCLARHLSADAICGPTHLHQTPFKWTDDGGQEMFPGHPHDGQPDLWNFDWVRMTPTGEQPIAANCVP